MNSGAGGGVAMAVGVSGGASGGSELVTYAASSVGVVTITLNSPKNRNALSAAVMAALSGALSRAEAAAGTRVVVLRATGPAFSSGHDIKEMRQLQERGSEDGAAALFSQCARLMMQVVRLPVPVIAAVHAVATAAGCQLAASCDIVLADRTATFATPGVTIGLFCSTPAVALTRAVGAKKAAVMLYTGLPQSAEDMRTAGLVNTVVEDDVHAAADELAEHIARQPTAVIKAGKATLLQQAGKPLGDAYDIAAAAMCTNLLRQPDATEGIAAFVGKRKPRFL